MNEKDVTLFYNKRGESEKNFDIQNNDFGWTHLPFSFMNENTVFMLITAMLKNFFLYLTQMLSGSIGAIKTTRVSRDSFLRPIFKWVTRPVPADPWRWIFSQYVKHICTDR